MPTYDYRCRACGVELEIFQGITERAKRKCPSCGQSKLERQIGTGAGILFKGSGFYQTDYRSAAYSQAEKAEKGGAGGAEKKGESEKAGGKSAEKPTEKGEPGAKDAATAKGAEKSGE